MAETDHMTDLTPDMQHEDTPKMSETLAETPTVDAEVPQESESVPILQEDKEAAMEKDSEDKDPSHEGGVHAQSDAGTVGDDKMNLTSVQAVEAAAAVAIAAAAAVATEAAAAASLANRDAATLNRLDALPTAIQEACAQQQHQQLLHHIGRKRLREPVHVSEASASGLGLVDGLDGDAGAGSSSGLTMDEPQQSKRSRKHTRYDEETIRRPIAEHALLKDSAVAGKKFAMEKFNLDIPASTIRDWMKAAKNNRVMIDELLVARAIPPEKATELCRNMIIKKKAGRPSCLNETTDAALTKFLENLRAADTPLSSTLALGAAQGLSSVLMRDKPPVLGKHWMQKWLNRRGWLKHPKQTEVNHEPADFGTIRAKFLEDFKDLVKPGDGEGGPVPAELIFNSDHTGLPLVSGWAWTLFDEQERPEAPRARLPSTAASGDKRQLTAIPGSDMLGNPMPCQVIYQGKTSRCQPRGFQWPDGWHIHHTETHLANNPSTDLYVEKVVIPHIERVRAALNLPNQRAIFLLNLQKCNFTEAWSTKLKECNVSVLAIPAKCTDLLQPVDLSVQGLLKQEIKRSWQEWYAAEVARQVTAGKDPASIEVDTAIKGQHAGWLVDAYNKIPKETWAKGFELAGLTGAYSEVVSGSGDLLVSRNTV